MLTMCSQDMGAAGEVHFHCGGRAKDFIGISGYQRDGRMADKIAFQAHINPSPTS